ncbi:uncharacterized protein LOC122247415 [Penaeus japonicus]|uniref:uncharacterized protein LOC122247415 n=1 Tax=Penaeus japonicus TaxID=27405 RepID=UPI001C70D996|nr:uncharacterized protein LOC122247415 [Penaeus japonicus]
MRVCRTLVLAAAFVVLESGASQDILPSSFLYNPPRDGGPPEDIKMLFKSRGPGVQSLGGASPVYTLVMERQQPLQPRNADGETHVIAASEPDPSANNESESLVNFMEPDTSTMPAGSGYSSTMSSKDRGSSAMTSSNKESSVKPSADFDLSTLLITDSGSPSIPSTVNIVSNSTVMPGSVLKPDSILNIADTKAHPNSHGIENSATEFYAFGGGNDIAGEATATTMEDLQGAHTNAANADTLSVDSGENALTDSTNGYDFSENLVTSSTDISDLEESASSTDKYVHTNRNNLTADEDFITFNGDESFTIFTGDGEYTEMPVITNTNTFIVGSGHASTARPQDQTIINTFSSDDPLPTRQRADIDPHLSEYSGDQFPASQQEDNDLAESQISADYVPLSNHDVEKSDSPAEPREDFSYFGLRNHFYHDGDLTLQVLGGGKSGDVKEDSEENPWEERTGHSGKESQERDLYFVLERDPKDAGRVTVKLGKSRETGRARANEHEPLDGRDDADNLYQYHLHDHKSGEYESGVCYYY